MTCDVCAGRGFTSRVGDWADTCKPCGGTGKLTFGRIAVLVNEERQTVVRLRYGKVRPATALRMCEALVRILREAGVPEFVKQPGLFT